MEEVTALNQRFSVIKDSHKVSGMTCASCAVNLESYLNHVKGVRQVAVNYPNQSVALEYDSGIVSIETLQQKALGIGYTILIGEAKEAQKAFKEIEEKRLDSLKSKLIISAIFSIPVFIMAMFFMGQIPYENWIMMMLSVPALFWSGSEFFVIAWNKLKHFSANMDTLVALSTGTAFVFSVFNTVYPQYFLSRGVSPHVYYESAVIIVTLILLGRFLEEKAKSKTSSAIKKLMDLKPKQVIVIRNGEEKTISFDEILKGELIILKPGDKVSVDGIVKKGKSFIDESMISGEPIPVSKTKGDKVFAGTINQKGSLRIIANKVGNETLLSQIIQLVEQAQASKPAIQKLVDKIAGIFVPIVIGIAILTFFIWYMIGPEPSFTYALLTLITVLIIACPCALGLATPTALMVGIGKGAQQGILIKDAQSLETAFKIDTLILDKTGTITEGKPKVTELVWAEGARVGELKQILLAIESQSEHPIAEAIVQHLKKEDTPIIHTDSFESITGMGAKSSFQQTTFMAGNERLMLVNDIDIPSELSQKAAALKLAAQTVIYFSAKNKVEGVIAVADQVKESSHSAIEQIQQMGIEIYMLTGDNEQTASAIASQVGIENFRANVMPADKGNFVKQLQEDGKTVAMVGDGINDSHALAQSDVGIAMGSGTDIAMESAGITLIHSNLKQIAKAIKLSKATMRTIRQNLFWAFIYNAIAIPIAAGVLYPFNEFLLNPMIAGAAMSLSSTSVLINSLRLRKRSIL
ncbi:heavy metal translocating P-type ATPase [Labilibaculum sp. DW002]|uniref:Heavy metal translocating P-type ATPase n=1 Tax=Paralabilibaculum antarcticum TaxID=2912572 RepID=A0ABT5VQ96_9BACT|nr:heavy metal translocating P-type ATPase [Labilibaculum sp. DW002]MDE5417607.1 heavy metal translocating P-type ATPase [Labilibaculum sp. DW002]